MTKRLALLFSVAVLAVLLVPALAFANFGPHGGYVAMTDSCAGCHRAHTAVSTITWADSAQNQHSALLVSSATTLYEFCYACHDATSQGADTNVQEGIYEGTLYGATGGDLNGGGFETFQGTPVSSTHTYNGSSWGAYGGGYPGVDAAGADGQIPGANPGESVQLQMDCGSCHDPHGSPNYRALKSVVNGNDVGGYVPSADPENPTPDAWVYSNELGYPAGGFKLHTREWDAVPGVQGYVPNYTTPLYAKGYDFDASTSAPNYSKGMSGWCVGCHSTYMVNNDGTPWNGVTGQLTKSDGTTYTAEAWVYNANDGSGLALRHKHPVNVQLSTYDGPDKAAMIIAGQTLPLANGFTGAGSNTPDSTDWVECLTCHRSHGTSAIMTGFASTDGANTIVGPDGQPTNSFVSATPSALLRLDNRGVCEACHNK